MNRIYSNMKTADIVIPARTGGMLVIPGRTAVRLDEWYDRYVPRFLIVSKQQADQTDPVRATPTVQPRKAAPVQTENTEEDNLKKLVEEASNSDYVEKPMVEAVDKAIDKLNEQVETPIKKEEKPKKKRGRPKKDVSA